MTDCIEFQGYRNEDGYGRKRWQGRQWGAHRLAWTLAHGPIPSGLQVLHRCDNPPCVNVGHLFLGTQTDNIADMDSKGRRNTDPRPVGKRHRGEHNHAHKLTWPQVESIRAEYAAGASKRGLSIRYGVSRPVIQSIVDGVTWIALHGTDSPEAE